MKLHHLIRELREENQTKIVLLVADGLGGLPLEANGRTELESARTPHLDACVRAPVLVCSSPADAWGAAASAPDPTRTGGAPLPPGAAAPAWRPTADAVNRFVAEAGRVLKDQAPTNMVTLRGFARYPKIETIQEVYGLHSAAIAVYPMYKGLARLVGMDVADAGSTLRDQVETLQRLWTRYDFFFLHYKYTDSTGEDGNFPAKVEMIERLDAEVPRIRALGPDVLIVTGDHSTPSKMKSHSWHPVPTVLWSQTCRPDAATEFGESYCLRGGLGQFQAMYLMPLALANAGRLNKY